MTTTQHIITLNFIENGEKLGSVHVVDGRLVGKPAFIKVVRTRMQRNQTTDAEATVRDMHGWSNGYLTTRLEGK